MNKNIKILFIIISIYFIGYFLESISHSSYIAGDYFEIFTEFLAVGLSFSIFVVTWYAYQRSRDNHSLFLGAAFLIWGLFDMFHMLSYPYMPEFITPNSEQKASVFSIVGVFVSCILFFASTYIYKNTHPKFINRKILFISINTVSFILLLMVLIYSEKLPLMYLEKEKPSSFMVFLQITSAVILLYTSYLYKKRYEQTSQEILIDLIYGFIVIILANIIYIFFDYTGHLMKAAGFYLVYLALYKSSIEQPYEEETRKETGLRLAAEERYRNLIDNSDDVIITTDLDVRITYWNRGGEKIIGWTMQEIAGKNLLPVIISTDIREESEQLFHKALLGVTVKGIETVIMRRDGIGIDVTLTISPLYNPNRNITGLSCIVRDITELKRAREIEIENLHLALSSKAKSEFLTSMSHDLGTPLNAILGFSVLLNQKIAGELNPKQESYVNNIITSGNRLLDIFNDVLDYGRAETGKIYLDIEKIPLMETINETICHMNEKIARHNVRLVMEFDPRIEFIEADRQRFKQILFNLLTNAVKYTKKEGGTVTIKTKKESNIAVFSVIDTGTGIREEDMGKIFKTFEQLDTGISSKYGSTGLGLVVTKKLIELHGGSIMVKSRYGEGSTFTFSLPIESKYTSL